MITAGYVVTMAAYNAEMNRRALWRGLAPDRCRAARSSAACSGVRSTAR